MLLTANPCQKRKGKSNNKTGEKQQELHKNVSKEPKQAKQQQQREPMQTTANKN